MANINQKLHDAIIAYQLDLRRFEAGTRKRVLSLFTTMEKELKATLVNADELTTFTRIRKQDLLRQVKLVIKNYYTQAQAELNLATQGLVDAQASHIVKTLESTVPVVMAASLPTETALARMAGASLIEGGLISDWWAKQTADTVFKVSNSIQQGIAQGENNSQVITRIIGKKGEQAGVVTMARANAAALVQTAMQTVANDSRLATFNANRDVIGSLVWFSALDGHVCPRCIARSGLKWNNSPDHEPVGHSVPFQNPPIHWNDRCVLLPVTKTFRELGIDMDEAPGGQRASQYGPVDAKTTFEDFLSRRTKDEQDEQLGPGRAQLWRDGKITLSQLIDGQGRELTLAQLRARYA